jgi:hypothetical protein
MVGYAVPRSHLILSVEYLPYRNSAVSECSQYRSDPRAFERTSGERK